MLHRARLLLRRIARIDVSRFPGEDAGYRRALLLAHHKIDAVIDVGASDGRYGAELRRFGYAGRIISFEPLPAAYELLAARAKKDSKWQTMPLALGAEAKEVALRIAANAGASSSILSMLPSHLRAAPDARVSSTVVVEQQRLDELWEELIDPSERVFVKLDVQGYEDRVLDGARICLDHWRGMQVEMSLVPLYSGGAQFDAIMAFAKAAGFSLMSLDAGFWDKSMGRMLQVDGTFFREART